MTDDSVLRNFLTDDGRLHTIPTRPAKRLAESIYRRSGGTVVV